MTARHYSAKRHGVMTRFPFVVGDADGGTALWRPDGKMGQLPARFRTEAIAQVFAVRLNAGARA